MKTPRVVIIDYGMGNLHSVRHACRAAGLTAQSTADGEVVRRAEALILPGVGAFREAMHALTTTGLHEAIREHIGSGRPFMGICLGFQLLFSRSEEFGDTAGMGVIPGTVRRIPASENGDRVKVPHVGWNTIHYARADVNDTPIKRVPDGSFMYFVHSYCADPEDPPTVLTETEYGGVRFCSSILKDNIFGVQFHPEKSGERGIRMYRDWLP